MLVELVVCGSAPHGENGLSTLSTGRRTEVVTEGGTPVLNNFDLKGIRVAVTGGTSGLGLALVRESCG